MTGVELLQNGIGRTLGFLGRAGAMISITLLSRAEDEPEYQIHIDTGVSILLNGVAYTSSAEINDDMPYGVCEFDQKAAALLASGDAFRLERLSYDEAYLLHVIFDNGLELHTRSTPGLCEEMWRIFLSWTADIHLIGYPDGIVEELPTLSQRELDESEYSWDPTIVYWRADDADEGKIGYGEAVCRLADHWYAALITR